MENYSLLNEWDGYCPESKIAGKKVRMRINTFDFFESEATGLQICFLPGVQAIILNFRGNGKFINSKKYADTVAMSEILSPQNLDTFPFNNGELFEDEKAVETYINGIS
jgi:hypothetical protein